MSNEIYERYFQIIEDHYGRYFKDRNPIESANKLLKNPMTARILYQTSDEIIDEINEFFRKNYGKIIRKIDSVNGIKTLFSGNTAPEDAERFLCKSGLYVDTTILSDPLTFVPLVKNQIPQYEYSRKLFKHAFNMLKLKKALINDSDIPILEIIPNPVFIKSPPEDYDKEVQKQTLDYFNNLFETHFKSISELEEFMNSLKSKDDLSANIKRPENLMPDIRKYATLNEGFEFLSEDLQYHGFQKESPSKNLYKTVKGSMIGNLLYFRFSRERKLINSFESPNFWHHYKWMLVNSSKSINESTFVLNAITLNKVKWFGNLKLDKVITARENSCLQDFRDILHKEINYSDDDKDIEYTAKRVEYNLKNAFDKHKSQLKQINSDFDLRQGASSAGIVGGTIASVSGIFSGDIMSSLGGGLATTGSLLSWIKSEKDYDDKKKIINSPVGILFDVRRSNE